jgi:glycosyltransferase involved in cell wall biosynthesis
MTLPRISIVTPCLNDARYLEEALCSIHSQNYPALEHIVIDGGSTDGSVEVIKRYENRLAYWVSETDAGHADALYKGLQRATGEIVTWVCSNDLLLPGALDYVGRFFQDNPNVQWAVGNGLTIDEESRVIERVWALPFTLRSILYWELWGTCQPAVFTRRSAMDRVGGIDRTLNVCVDTDLFIRLARLETPARIPHFLAALRIHKNSQSLTLAGRVRETDDRIKMRAGRPNGPASLMKMLYRLYYWRYRGFQVLNETFRREKYYQQGALIRAGLA